MNKLSLPCIVIHRGRLYQLNETVRHGLILQKADQQKLVDVPKSTVYILQLTRVALRELNERLPSHSPRMNGKNHSLLGLVACQEAHNDREGQMTQRTKAKTKAKKQKVREVVKLREPVRESFVHCERPMRKLSGINTGTGEVGTVYSCDRCGVQQRPAKPVSA